MNNLANCVDCSPSGEGPSRGSRHPTTDQAYELIHIEGYPILVKRDPVSGYLFDIKMQEKTDLTELNYPNMKLMHVFDNNNGLEFGVWTTHDYTRWLVVFPLDEKKRDSLITLGVRTLRIRKREAGMLPQGMIHRFQNWRI